MERCIFNKMFEYLQENYLLIKYQAAYMPGSSTETQLLELYHMIMEALDGGKEVKFLFLDVSKAFDRVWHKGILEKLKKCGITGKLLEWLSNYLSDREQCVVVEGAKSKYGSIKAGVPQGSILGPLLFLIYVNDLPSLMESNIRVYADDTSLFIDYDTANIDVQHRKLQRDIGRVEQWAKDWLMEFNPSKTQSLTFSRKRGDTRKTLKMNNIDIEEVTQHKHLGLTLQRNGKWNIHIAETITKAKKKVDIMRGLMWKLNRKSLEILYLAFIRPCLEYGSTTWDNCTKKEKTELEQVQIAALRAITGAKKGTSHSLMYSDTGIEPLQLRRDRRKLTMMFKIQTKKCPLTLQELKPKSTRERTHRALRSDSNPSLIKAKTESFNTSFLPETIRMWNKLPEDKKNAGSVEQFKEAIRPKKTIIPRYVYGGDRRAQILHTRLRLRRSDLNEEMFEVNLINTPWCDCGEDIEDAEHFLTKCRRYNDIRKELAIDVRQYSTEELLKGNTAFEEKENEKIFKEVQNFILKSKRFR